MKILLTNDDGISAIGMEYLVELVAGFGHEVYVVAPKKNRSGAGQSISLGRKVEIRRCELHTKHEFVQESWSVDGNPADAVKYALGNEIVKPDLLLSGINSGPNLGRNIFYSGTVGAAMEGVFHGVTSIALSAYNWEKPKWEPAVHYGRIIVSRVLKLLETGAEALPAFLLNVNFPDLEISEVKGVRLTRQGCSGYMERFHPCTDGEEDMYYLDGIMTEPDTDESTDFLSVKNGYVSASAFIPDITSSAIHRFLSETEMF